jgi:hypothetical protein
LDIDLSEKTATLRISIDKDRFAESKGTASLVGTSILVVAVDGLAGSLHQNFERIDASDHAGPAARAVIVPAPRQTALVKDAFVEVPPETG